MLKHEIGGCVEPLFVASVALGIISIWLGQRTKRLQRAAQDSQDQLSGETASTINDLGSLLDAEDYLGFIESLERHASKGEVRPSKNLATRFAKCLIVEHLIQLGQEEMVFEIGVFDQKNGELSLEISESETVVCFPGHSQLYSFSILVRLDLLRSGNAPLEDIANSWERWESGFKPEYLEQAQLLDSNFIENARKWSLANLKDELIIELYDEDLLISNPKNPLYAGGSSYYFSNLVYPSGQRGLAPCPTCGTDRLFCSEDACQRAYFGSSTGIDCSVEVRGMQAEGSRKQPFVGVGIIVCELEQEEIWLALQERIPTIKGSLQLQNNSMDGKTYISLGGRYLDGELSASKVTQEDFEELFDVQVTHPRLQADEYLVVAWQTASEAAESCCFVFTLLRAQARSLVLEALA